MVANNSGGIVHYLAGKYPGKIGWLISPGGFKEPRVWLPYAVDNGKFTCWSNGSPWNVNQYFGLLDKLKLRRYKPLWVLVPDEVANAQETLRLWNEYSEQVSEYGWPLAFAVQDGMTPSDVPARAEVVFVGGSTKWKWKNAPLFRPVCERLHIGRVNWNDKLEFCETINAESCDGTGFFRGGEDSPQSLQLQRFLAGHRTQQEQLFV